ncbi:unnamed protein product [Gemmataceae bacterium]|nr:unnamed protein product [Gemmataceae bacterium]VTT96592.1 unnamed protein product [Gemmataceae bacterium]
MSALITALLAFFGPILAELIKKWLATAADRLPAAETFASEDQARDALFDQAIADLPKRARGRRALLRRLKGVAAASGVTSAGPARPVSAADAEELADLFELAVPAVPDE